MTTPAFRTLLCAVTLSICSVSATAHPGRTDAQGGHTDKKSGTYHFHNKRAPVSGAVDNQQRKAKEELAGVISRVKDGDTVVLTTQDGTNYNIRLYGIDAPEMAQRFGKEAKQHLSGLVFKKRVTIRVMDTDRYGRKVGIISLDEKTTINEKMVTAGFAWWYAKYARKDTALKDAEAKARLAKRGLWVRPNPLPPWEYRK